MLPIKADVCRTVSTIGSSFAWRGKTVENPVCDQAARLSPYNDNGTVGVSLFMLWKAKI